MYFSRHIHYNRVNYNTYFNPLFTATEIRPKHPGGRTQLAPR